MRLRMSVGLPAATRAALSGAPDTTAPTLLGVSTNIAGDKLILAFSELLGAFAPAAGQITLTGTSATPASTAVVDNTLEVSLTGFVELGETVTASYVVPVLNYIRDEAGNAAEAFADHAVTNNSEYEIVPPEWIGFASDTSTTGAARTPNLSAITLQAGDVLVALCQNRSTSSDATLTEPASQGWIEVPGVNAHAAGFSEYWFYKYWGIEGQTDDTTPTFTWSTGGNVNRVAIAVARNCKSGTPFTVTPLRTQRAAATTITSAPVVDPGGDFDFAKTLTLTGFHFLDDNTPNAHTRGTVAFADNLSTFAAMALIYEQGVDSSVETVSLTESTQGPDACRVITLVLDGAPRVPEPTFNLTLLSTTGYGAYKTNATGWQQSSVVSDVTARAGYYWRYAAWYDRAPSPESRLWLAAQRRPEASDPLDPDSWETVSTQAVASGLNPNNSAADPHLSPSLGVDETGRLVLMWNAHWNEFQYGFWRGSAPGDINCTTNTIPTGLPADLSYPKLFRDSFGLMLTARIGVGGSGTQGFWELNATTGEWVEIDDAAISFAGGSPYMQHVHVNPATGVMHFSFINATDQYTAAYRDIYYFSATRSGAAGSGPWTFKSVDGVTRSLPIDTSAHFLAQATGLDRGLQVHQGLSSTVADVPLISVFYAKDGATDRTGGSNRYLITRDGGAWVRQLVHEVHPAWNLIGGNGNHYDPDAPNNEYPQASPANVLYDAATGAVHLAYRTNYELGSSGIPALMVTSSFAAPYTTWTEPEILIDTPFGDSGPTHDCEAWSEFGLASWLATLCDVATPGQYPGGSDANVYVADALAMPTA